MKPVKYYLRNEVVSSHNRLFDKVLQPGDSLAIEFNDRGIALKHG